MNLVPQSEPMATMPGRPIGQMARSVAGYSVLLSVMMVVPLTVFAPAALFDCAWRNGRRAAVMALALASAFVVLVSVRVAQVPPVIPHYLALNLGMLVTLLFSLGLPALVVLPMVQRGEAFGRVLMTATVGGIMGLGASELVMRTTTGTSPFETEYNGSRDNFAPVMKDNPTLPSDAQRLFGRVSAGFQYCLAAGRVASVVLPFTLSVAGLFDSFCDFRHFNRKDSTHEGHSD